MRVCVFCSCSNAVSPLILDESQELGRSLASWGYEVLYGGTDQGSMGALAKGVLSQGGRLTGVIPESSLESLQIQRGLSEQIMVANLSERKQVMLRLADAFVILPGGLGTLDEIFEVLALKSIGAINKPVVLYNFLDVWTPLLEALELLVQQRLIRTSLDEVMVVLDKREQLREHLSHVLRSTQSTQAQLAREC